MELPGALCAIEAKQGRALIGHIATADLPAEGVAVLPRLLRQATGDRIHHAPEGSRAVEHGGGPLQDFDLIGEKGFHGHGVIAAGARSVKHPHPVLKNLHPGIGEAADDGPAHGGAEVGGLNTRKARHRIPQVRPELPRQRFPGQNFHGLGHLVRARPHRGGINANFLERCLPIGAVHGSRCGLGRRGKDDGGRQQGQAKGHHGSSWKFRNVII